MISCPRCGRENADDARFCSNCGTALGVGPAASEVRKTVTVMFMDAVGSTALGERADPESLRRVMTRYFDEIRTIVERHGGTVEKYIGDAVMAVFGVPVVHEDDALRAARAAAEIQTRLRVVDDELQRQRGSTIAWRTGINTGEVVAGDAGAGQRFVTGDAVNVAARLEQAAQPGEILVGQETYQLIRDAVLVEPTEPLTAKGKSKPLTAYRLIDVPAGGTSPARRVDSPMIGRQRQRRLLAEAYEQVVDERVCHLFTILGAAGVGKSRLVSEFLAELGGGALVLHGRSLSYGEGITYWPIAEAIRVAAGLVEGDDEPAVRTKLGGLVDNERDRAQVVERIGALIGLSTGTGSAEETFWAVRTALESLARRQPLVLVLDDVHWAEPTLLDLVEHLADWTVDAPVLLLCVARQELLEARPGWGGGKSYATTLTLEPLNDAESQQLMVSLLGQVELGGQLVDKIAAAAEGNPLFVEEMIAMLIDSGVLVQTDGKWTAASALADVTVPPSIQALLAARLDRLPVPERAVIERGAVEGKVFHRGAVAELTLPDLRESVPLHLRALSRKELVRPDRSDFYGDEGFRFRHLLIRDAAYSAMPKESRADLHARFAEWLERMAGDHVTEYEEILGYHLEQAYRYRTELGPLDDEGRRLGAEAARHLGASAERAAQRGDSNAALKLFRAAFDLTPEIAHERYRLAAGLGLALVASGDLRAADALLATEMERARATGDELGAAYTEVFRLDTQGTLGTVTVEQVLTRSEELLAFFDKRGDTWGAMRAQLELARHHFFAGRALTAHRLLMDMRSRYPAQVLPPMVSGMALASVFWGPTPVEQPLEILQGFDVASSRVIEAFVLRVSGGLRGLVGDFDAGREMHRRAMEIEVELGRRPFADGIAGHFLAPMEMAAGNYEEAERLMLGAYERMSASGDTAFSSTVAGNLAALYIALGRWEEADRFARITLDTAQPDDAEAQAQGWSALGRVQAARGELDQAEASAGRAVEVAEGTDYLERRGLVLSDFAEVLVTAGRMQEARDAFGRALENFEAKGATAHVDQTRKRLAEIAGGEG
ncbi:MAG: adenylate/guanylate cyclase domain-containing protein [Chloroflexota bacterium]